MSLDWSKDVMEFHKKIKYTNGSFPSALTHADYERRTRYLEEEMEEFSLAYEEEDLGDQIDSLIDLIYFAVGTLLRMGVDPRPHWDLVHKANMLKVPNREAFKNSDKPADWEPPDHEAILTGLENE